MGKLLILLGAIAGIASFFLPLIHWEHKDPKVKLSVSGFKYVSGVSATRDLFETEATLTPAQEKQLLDDANEGLTKARGGVYLIYAPVALLLLVALLSMAMGLGRGKGILALLAGGAALLFWSILNKALTEKSDGLLSAGLGMTLILAVAGGGILGGLFALVKPDRKPAPSAA